MAFWLLLVISSYVVLCNSKTLPGNASPESHTARTAPRSEDNEATMARIAVVASGSTEPFDADTRPVMRSESKVKTSDSQHRTMTVDAEASIQPGGSLVEVSFPDLTRKLRNKWKQHKAKQKAKHKAKHSHSANATADAEDPQEEAPCMVKNKRYKPLNMDGQQGSFASSVFKCQQRCASVAGCAHFSYSKLGVCHLQDENAELRRSIGTLVGPPQCNTGPAKYNRVPGAKFCKPWSTTCTSGCTLHSAASADDCQGLCTAHPPCLGANFFPNKLLSVGRCYLFPECNESTLGDSDRGGEVYLKEVPCQWAEWKEWGECTATCGGGDTQRRREILIQAMNRGDECKGPFDETKECHAEPCATTTTIAVTTSSEGVIQKLEDLEKKEQNKILGMDPKSMKLLGGGGLFLILGCIAYSNMYSEETPQEGEEIKDEQRRPTAIRFDSSFDHTLEYQTYQDEYDEWDNEGYDDADGSGGFAY